MIFETPVKITSRNNGRKTSRNPERCKYVSECMYAEMYAKMCLVAERAKQSKDAKNMDD